MEEQFAKVGDIEMAYRIYGSDQPDVLMLVGGLDTTLATWDPEMLEMLIKRGFSVIVADNRDSGLSTQLAEARFSKLGFFVRSLKGQLGVLQPADVPYTFVEMARDWLGLLDVLDFNRVHVCGHSLGGMVAQEIAIAAPERVASLTCISSSTGERHVGRPWPKAALLVSRATGKQPELAVERLVKKYAFTSGPDGTRSYARARAEASLFRSNTPDGRMRRLLAGPATRSRVAQLKSLSMPVVVLHGALDPTIQIDGGRRLAKLAPRSEFNEVARMGHELIPPFFGDIVQSIERARQLSKESE
ncbi:MAG: alpha/beta hydrolase [Pseudomonadota bacterium]